MDQLGSEHEVVTASYEEANALLQRESFDAALIDLLMPAPKLSGCSTSPIIGQEMPMGPILAFLALKAGVQLVAVVTNMNHHNHPASAAFDSFIFLPQGGDYEVRKRPFRLGNAVILLTNNHVLNYGERKAWARVLAELCAVE